MNNNKILIELEIPLIEQSYDLFIPINKKIGTIKTLVEDGLIELTDNAYTPKDSTNFYSKETGQIYEAQTSNTYQGYYRGTKTV